MLWLRIPASLAGGDTQLAKPCFAVQRQLQHIALISFRIGAGDAEEKSSRPAQRGISLANGKRMFSSIVELLNKIVCITVMQAVKRKLLHLAQPLEAFGQLRRGEVE